MSSRARNWSRPARPGPRPRSGRTRRRTTTWRPLLVLGLLLIVAGIVYAVTRSVRVVAGPECSFRGAFTYQLDPGQAQEASVIAAAGRRLGLPDHAVTIALAAALQESKLRNLNYGDRDSVGLFQQRPSEGWGTAAQILDPNYASTAFYQHLLAVPGWQELPVAEAAQAVQHSADGSAYASWEAEARTLAVDLTGEAPASVACRLTGFGGPVPEAGALVAAGQAELGMSPYEPDPGPQVGWRLASWLVAHAYAYHLSSVSYAGLRWTASSGRWVAAPSADPATVSST